MARGRQIVRVLATLAVAFGVAVVLSWGILGFFGQRSADRAEHSLVGILLLLGYMAASGSISVRRSAFFSRPLFRATWERSSQTWTFGC